MSTAAAARRVVGKATPRRSPVRAIFAVLVVLSVGSFFAVSEFNALPALPILELTLVFAVLVGLRRIYTPIRGVLLASIVYVLVKFLLMLLLKPASLSDFAQAYKAYLYVPLLALCVRSGWLSRRQVAVLTDWLLLAFGLKYLISVLLLHIDRPGLFDESNFELVLLIGLTYIAAAASAQAWPRVTALTAVVLLSQSRSAILGLGICYIALMLRSKNRALVPAVAGLGVLGVLAYQLFVARSHGLGLNGVDRFHFLQFFLRETRDWGPGRWLLGTPPLSPLTPATCADLSFYRDLISDISGFRCYSVIFHAFLLRAVFDQGLLGLALLLFWMHRLLTIGGSPPRERLTLLAMILVNGVSVSAFNSVFSALLFALVLASAEPVKRNGSVRPDRSFAYAETTIRG